MKRLACSVLLALAVFASFDVSGSRVVWRDASPFGWLFGGQPLVAAYIPYLVKSIQRGTITISTTTNTATVTAVVVANCDLRYLGSTYSQGSTITERSMMAYVSLTNTTTVTAIRQSSADGGSVVAGYELLEYYPGVVKSRQANTLALAGVASNTVTITSVNTALTSLTSLGAVTDGGNGFGADYLGMLALTNATTVTGSRAGTANTLTFSYQALERYR